MSLLQEKEKVDQDTKFAQLLLDHRGKGVGLKKGQLKCNIQITEAVIFLINVKCVTTYHHK